MYLNKVQSKRTFSVGSQNQLLKSLLIIFFLIILLMDFYLSSFAFFWMFSILFLIISYTWSHLFVCLHVMSATFTSTDAPLYKASSVCSKFTSWNYYLQCSFWIQWNHFCIWPGDHYIVNILFIYLSSCKLSSKT